MCLLTSFSMLSCTEIPATPEVKDPVSEEKPGNTDNKPANEGNEMPKLYITIGEETHSATLVDNDAAKELAAKLQNEPLTVTLNDGGFEIWGSLGFSLPTSNQQISAGPGDIILYGGSSICLFYGSNTYSYTRLGKIDSLSENELRTFLKSGQNNVSVTLSLTSNTTKGVPTVKLSSGYEMPVLGMGCYALHGDVCRNAILSAIKLGFRKFDTASFYGNEEEVGDAIRQAIEEGLVTREELFVTTKLYPGSEFSHPKEAIEGCLKRLNIGYVDLMLLHHPGTNDVKAYEEMEKYVAAGKIRSLGVSNFYIDEMTDLLKKVKTKPVLTQNEIHPHYNEAAVVKFMHENGIEIEAWYPLGGRISNGAVLKEPVLNEIAEAHSKSVVQIILRWDIQNGVIVIPGSSNPDHQKENISVFDFELSDEEMEKINKLQKNKKYDWY